jgi:hypothetical protein
LPLIFLNISVYFFTSVKSKRTKHRGEILRAAAEKGGMNITVLARKAGYSRTSYYNHIMEPELSYDILLAYGKAMKHDFSSQLPEINKSLVEEDTEDYTRPTTMEQALKLADKWKAKYYALLEKYNQMLEEKLKR